MKTLILFSFWIGFSALAQYGGTGCKADSYQQSCEAVNGGSYQTIYVPGCTVTCPPNTLPICEVGSYDSKYCGTGHMIPPSCQCVRAKDSSGLDSSD